MMSVAATQDRGQSAVRRPRRAAADYAPEQEFIAKLSRPSRASRPSRRRSTEAALEQLACARAAQAEEPQDQEAEPAALRIGSRAMKFLWATCGFHLPRRAVDLLAEEEEQALLSSADPMPPDGSWPSSGSSSYASPPASASYFRPGGVVEAAPVGVGAGAPSRRLVGAPRRLVRPRRRLSATAELVRQHH